MIVILDFFFLVWVWGFLIVTSSIDNLIFLNFLGQVIKKLVWPPVGSVMKKVNNFT